MNRFVIGDIHGAYLALVQCLLKSGFSKTNDLLICLGDLCDGWPDVVKVFKELLSIQNKVVVLGNHDQWLLNWFNTGEAPEVWLSQGGEKTINLLKNMDNSPFHELLRDSRLYYEMDNRLFVHGGFLPELPIEQQNSDILLWDRSLVRSMLLCKQMNQQQKLTSYDMVYIGHTPTINFGEHLPITKCGVCLMDTGAGWAKGRLTIQDIDSHVYYCSDVMNELYKDSEGR